MIATTKTPAIAGVVVSSLTLFGSLKYTGQKIMILKERSGTIVQ